MSGAWFQQAATAQALLRLGELDQLDHVRGAASAPAIVEYGDYQCEHSKEVFRAIERLESSRAGGLRHAFRHFPVTKIHPHAFAAAAAAEAAALQGRFWEMHALLFHSGRFLADDLRAYAGELGLDLARFERDRLGGEVRARVERDVAIADASGEVHTTPTLVINGKIDRSGYDDQTLLRALER
jgi:protein-disulfide isomerase